MKLIYHHLRVGRVGGEGGREEGCVSRPLLYQPFKFAGGTSTYGSPKKVEGDYGGRDGFLVACLSLPPFQVVRLLEWR